MSASCAGGWSGPRLIVDLGAIRRNYRTVRRACERAEAAAVVKANAYGLGLERVVEALQGEGCRTFFTAFAAEAATLREMAPEADIYVLSPLLDSDSAVMIEQRLTPCLYEMADIRTWCERAAGGGARAPLALHLETGINRLGLDEAQLRSLLDDTTLRCVMDIRLVMAHLACADDPHSPMNAAQRDRFRALRALLPDARAGLCNSGGVFLGADYHFDLVRPGVCLFGHDPQYRHVAGRIEPVATLEAPLAQVKILQRRETVGYGATWKADRSATVGVVLAGYADGIDRRLSRHPAESAYRVGIDGCRAPLLGTVSMDMVVVDLSEVPERLRQPGTPVEFFGGEISIESMAEAAGTIPYELLVRVGPRVVREYREA